MGVDSLPIKERVDLMLVEEKLVFNCMNENLVKWNLKLHPASVYDDKANKTDAYLVGLQDTLGTSRKRCAIKVRDSRHDILVAVRDPYYGEGDPRTKVGRDMLKEYHLYITRDPGKTKLRVAYGKVIHKIINDMMEELAAKGYRIEKGSPFLSGKHPGCELRKHYDARSGHPKILGFIPPEYLKEGKEIVYFEYKE